MSDDRRILNLMGGPLPGGGPWAILADCPAPRHNTCAAAVKGGRVGTIKLKCICPRALALKDADLDKRREEHRRWYRNNKARHLATVASTRESTAGSKVAVPTEVHAPDMRLAACRTPEGRRAAAAVIDRADVRNIETMREICNTPCPIKAACRAWVLAGEVRPGSWGGMYGGLSVRERKEMGVAA